MSSLIQDTGHLDPVEPYRSTGSLFLAIALALMATGPGAAPETIYLGPDARLSAADAELAAAAKNIPELATFYAQRNYRPLWFYGERPLPAAFQLIEMLRASVTDGLDPARFHVTALERALNEGPSPALEVALSENYVAFIRDLRRPAAPNRFFYVDSQLAPELRAGAILASAPAHSMHPLYEGLRRLLATPGLSPMQVTQIRLNLDRARALPSGAARHIIVDTASARLWLYEGRSVVDTMPVVVGKQRLQTPVLAGLIRFAMLQPYWNLPPDLTRERARHVLRDGVETLKREQLEVLSGWEAAAHVIDPSDVDWAAVAAGTAPLRMRQLPGVENMMGDIKFMLPNRLGIYLHDTPLKGDFARDDRRLSSGCVRVEDAPRLARWLFGGIAPTADGTPEQRVALPRPVPVYIGYFTVRSERGRPVYQEDRYGRDMQAGKLIPAAMPRRAELPLRIARLKLRLRENRTGVVPHG